MQTGDDLPASPRQSEVGEREGALWEEELAWHGNISPKGRDLGQVTVFLYSAVDCISTTLLSFSFLICKMGTRSVSWHYFKYQIKHSIGRYIASCPIHFRSSIGISSFFLICQSQDGGP